jgi:hypothetical protein
VRPSALIHGSFLCLQKNLFPQFSQTWKSMPSSKWYTHAVSDDDRKVSAAFGAVLSQAFSKNESAKEVPEQLSLQLPDSEGAA